MTEIWSNVNTPDGKNIPYLDHKRFFSCLVPTASNLINIDSAVALMWIAKSIGRQLNFCASVKTGIPSARGLCNTIARQYYGVNKIRGLWLDSDILIMNPDVVAKYIKDADEGNYNICANYRTGTIEHPTNLIMKSWDTDCHMSNEELDALPDLSEITWSGLGFYYGDIDLNYIFRADTFSGEDYNYFKDQDLHPRFAKGIKLGHCKNLVIK